jgi:hypothetical protein
LPRPRLSESLFFGDVRWKPGDPVATIGEIAQRLRPIAPNVEATVIRLRHWTTGLMLVPIDKMHAGTGKHRVYAADDVYNAAILHVLADFGLTISAVRPFWVDILFKARLALPEWKKKQGALYLKIWRRSPGIGAFVVNSEPPQFEDLKRPYDKEESLPPELMLAIDLAALLGRIEP